MATPTTPGGGPRAGALVNNLMEVAGYGFLIAFAASWGARWAFLAAAVVLVVVANARAARARPRTEPRPLERLARAVAAYRAGSP
ncbi:hypothetical protein ACIA59_10580 [Micromonospora haikouensis]|uniref:hypothetical protein n=1 Tax=Micromonospora haikouensis TaxID=686309 RepID=UPI00379E4E97